LIVASDRGVSLALGWLFSWFLLFPKVVKWLVGHGSFGVVGKPKLLDPPAEEDTYANQRNPDSNSNVRCLLMEEPMQQRVLFFQW
jgi:hypothetical protein